MKYYQMLLFVLLITLVSCKHQNEIKPERKNIVDAVFASGHTENNNQYTIMANAEGYIQNSYVVEGDTVKSDQRLFRILNNVQETQVQNAVINLDFAKTNASAGSPQIEQLQVQIAQAAHKLTVDSANYQRYARLVKSQAVSTTDFENAQLNFRNSQSSLRVLQKNLADLRHNLKLNVDNAKAQVDIQQENNGFYEVTSQAPGIVMNLAKKTGDYVKKGDAIATLGTGGVIIKLDIAEDDIGRVIVGQHTLISLNSEKEKTYNATITKIYPAFNSTDQSFIAEATFETIPKHILNGTQLQANIIIQTKSNALVIPSYYLVNDDEVLLNGSKQKHKVTVGIRTLEWTEITGGISENDVLTAPNL
jgi:multidrug efflux pump subunit AcrA (membrane-fusion protein)